MSLFFIIDVVQLMSVFQCPVPFSLCIADGIIGKRIYSLRASSNPTVEACQTISVPCYGQLQYLLSMSRLLQTVYMKSVTAMMTLISEYLTIDRSTLSVFPLNYSHTCVERWRIDSASKCQKIDREYERQNILNSFIGFLGCLFLTPSDSLVTRKG